LGKKLSNEQFTERIVNLVGLEYSFLEPYSGRHTRILCQHNKCGFIWKVEAGAFLGNKNKSGSRCPMCCPVNNHKKSNDTFKKQVHDLTDGEYELVSKYKNARTKVKILHKKCGNTYEVVPYSFLHNNRCWYCAIGGHPYDTKYARKLVKDKTLGTYELVGEYKSAIKKVVIRHIECGACFETTFQEIASHGIRCSACFGSHGEASVASWLSNNKKYYICQKKFKGLVYKSILSYDFFIPGDKTLIEFQGVQHYEPVEFFGGDKKFEMQKESDRRKKEYADNNGYRLIAIPYTFDNRKAVYSFLNKNY